LKLGLLEEAGVEHLVLEGVSQFEKVKDFRKHVRVMNHGWWILELLKM